MTTDTAERMIERYRQCLREGRTIDGRLITTKQAADYQRRITSLRVEQKRGLNNGNG